MSTLQLDQIKDQLQSGDRYKLAVAMGVNPAKIKWALDGLVKSDLFMAKLKTEVKKLIEAREQVS